MKGSIKIREKYANNIVVSLHCYGKSVTEEKTPSYFHEAASTVTQTVPSIKSAITFAFY